MSPRLRWLGRSVLPFLQWARERMLGSEDFVIVECVSQFDDVALQEIMQPIFRLICLQVSPRMFGEAVDRPRKYIILISKRRLVWEASIVRDGHQIAFERLFARRMKMDAAAKFRATDEAGLPFPFFLFAVARDGCVVVRGHRSLPAAPPLARCSAAS